MLFLQKHLFLFLKKTKQFHERWEANIQIYSTDVCLSIKISMNLYSLSEVGSPPNQCLAMEVCLVSLSWKSKMQAQRRHTFNIAHGIG